MPTAAGKTCEISGVRISVVTDGRYCARCGVAFHIDALECDKNCPACRVPFARSNARQEEERKRDILRAESRVTVRRIWLTAGISVLLCLIPLGLSLFGALTRETPFEIPFLRKFNQEMLLLGKAPLLTLFGASVILYLGAILYGVVRRPHGWLRPLIATLVFAVVAMFYLFVVLNTSDRWWPETD